METKENSSENGKRGRASTAGISYQNKSSVSSKVITSGITLVALVVTIVVLLILAGITIMYVMGDNSVFKMATDAKNNTEQAKEEEKEGLGKYEEIIEQYGYGKNPKAGSDKKGEILTANKTDYTDDTGTAVIPGGFCVVKDSEEDREDINTVENGLVISDVADDDLDNSKHGNQFVWVPVPDYSKFYAIDGYSGGSLQNIAKSISEAGDTDTWGYFNKPPVSGRLPGTTESKAMFKSVKENKGFYIARFEAGIVGTEANVYLETKTIADGSVKPLSQRGVGVWDSIEWGGKDAYDKGATDGQAGNDSNAGAVKVARAMYNNDDTHKVTSTLCYGVQWDAALNFIDPTYITGNSSGYVKDSTGKGNYSAHIVAVTGSDLNYQQKHIYDMAGNEAEWTWEAWGNWARIVRGGHGSTSGLDAPASFREKIKPFAYGPCFRVTLFI